jgi:large subunit ribosomal protein L34e
MVRRSLRTRSRVRKAVRTPGGRVTIHYVGEKPGRPRCSVCGKQIHGIPSEPGTAHSSRTVSRAYGGVLCSNCLEQGLLNAVSAEWGFA